MRRTSGRKPSAPLTSDNATAVPTHAITLNLSFARNMIKTPGIVDDDFVSLSRRLF
jgi:hypothetical protein